MQTFGGRGVTSTLPFTLTGGSVKGTGRLPFSPADPQELKRRQAAIEMIANTYFIVLVCVILREGSLSLCLAG